MLSLKPRGFPFGTLGLFYLVKLENEDGHIFIGGGSGSRKTKSIGIPACVSWRQRIFAIDVKGELAKKTSFARPTIKVFSPLDKNAYGYDPYYFLKKADNQAQAAREIALSIVPAEINADPYFAEAAQNILTGAILHFFNLGYSFIETLMAVQNTPNREMIAELFDSDTLPARYCVKDYVSMEQDDLANIFSGLGNKLIPFVTDESLIDCLSRSRNIKPSDLESGFDVFLSVPEAKIEEWRGLLTLITRQFLKHFYRRPDDDPALTPILFLIDEFPRLGKVEGILNALATLRSKKITICLIAQDLSQLDLNYTHDGTRAILSNCAYKAFLSCSDPDSQDYISRLIGTTDIVKTSQNKSFKGQETDVVRSTGTSETTQENAIRKPADLAYLPKQERIDLVSPDGYRCIKKIPYNAKAFSPVYSV